MPRKNSSGTMTSKVFWLITRGQYEQVQRIHNILSDEAVFGETRFRSNSRAGRSHGDYFRLSPGDGVAPTRPNRLMRAGFGRECGTVGHRAHAPSNSATESIALPLDRSRVMDINYLLRREQESLARSLSSPSRAARAVHHAFAIEYGRLLVESSYPHNRFQTDEERALLREHRARG